MVDIRVAVEDVTRVPSLVRRLATVIYRTSISFDTPRLVVQPRLTTAR
jgi:hypothetical protein